MKHFLLVYRRSAGKLLEFRDLGTDGTAALRERFAIELREKDDPDVEVVVLSAKDRATIEGTHARYFKTMAELAADLEEAVAAIGEP